MSSRSSASRRTTSRNADTADAPEGGIDPSMATPKKEKNLRIFRFWWRSGRSSSLHLGEELYGVDIAAIHTVITPQAITPVPRTARLFKGVMNLRGPHPAGHRPADALRPAGRGGQGPRIVIVEVGGLSAGLIVDGVSRCCACPKARSTPPSQLIASAESDCIPASAASRPGGRPGAADHPARRDQTLVSVLADADPAASGGGLREHQMPPDSRSGRRRLGLHAEDGHRDAGARPTAVRGRPGAGRRGRPAKTGVLRPDVVTLDIEMPVMDGLATLARSCSGTRPRWSCCRR